MPEENENEEKPAVPVHRRALRRHHEKRVQKARIAKQEDPAWWPDIREHPRYVGQLKNIHFGCGCWMCKPWKHGKDYKHKPSERRKLG